MQIYSLLKFSEKATKTNEFFCGEDFISKQSYILRKTVHRLWNTLLPESSINVDTIILRHCAFQYKIENWFIFKDPSHGLIFIISKTIYCFAIEEGKFIQTNNIFFSQIWCRYPELYFFLTCKCLINKNVHKIHHLQKASQETVIFCYVFGEIKYIL